MYKYLSEAIVTETVINKSSFLAHLFPVTSKTEIDEILNKYKTVDHPKATHYCYAYVLNDNKIQKYSDDGEPAKTAGLPILDVLLKNKIDDCLALVVRYYGGIKLGAGGLTRAYRNAVASAVQTAKLIKKVMTPMYFLRVEYSLNDQLNNMLKNRAVICKHDFKEKVEFSFYTFDSQLIEQISELIGGEKPQQLENIKVEIPS